MSHLWLLALLEESLLALLLVRLLPGKVLVTTDLLHRRVVNTADIDLCPGSNDVAGVDTSERNTVDLEWTSDEEDTLRQVLEEDDTLAAETTSEENEDGTGLKSWARLPCANSLAGLKKIMSVILQKKLCVLHSRAG